MSIKTGKPVNRRWKNTETDIEEAEEGPSDESEERKRSKKEGAMFREPPPLFESRPICDILHIYYLRA